MRKSTYVPVLVTVGVLMLAYRTPQARKLLTGDEPDTGWFGGLWG